MDKNKFISNHNIMKLQNDRTKEILELSRDRPERTE